LEGKKNVDFSSSFDVVYFFEMIVLIAIAFEGMATDFFYLLQFMFRDKLDQKGTKNANVQNLIIFCNHCLSPLTL